MEFAVDRLIQPVHTEDSGDYREYREACVQKGLEPEELAEPLTFCLERADFRLPPAAKTTYAKDNDYSIMAELEYGKSAFFSPGMRRTNGCGSILMERCGPSIILRCRITGGNPPCPPLFSGGPASLCRDYLLWEKSAG